MQKVLFITTILLTLFALSIRAEHNPRKKPDVSAQFQTVSGHSISLNGIGLAYSYEYAFAPKGTIIFSAGSSYAFGRILQLKMESLREFHIDTKDYHLVTGDLAIEPRFYYNLKKRHRNGKRTWGNSGGYLSVNFGYSFPITITSGVKAAHIYVITPYWGFRRVWKHFLFDLSGGVGYIGSSNGTSAVYPGLRIGLGYRFRSSYFNCRISNQSVLYKKWLLIPSNQSFVNLKSNTYEKNTIQIYRISIN